MDSRLEWKMKGKKELLKTVVLSVNEINSQAPDGSEGKYIVMDAPDWVIVIPVLGENFLMVKQWRHGINALSIEFPGGVIDKGEEPEHAAKRELEEETGCKTEELIKIGEVSPNPALFNNHVHVFLARKLVPTGVQHLDNDEFINFMELPKQEVLDGMGTEQFPHGIMGTALMFYLKFIGTKI